MTRPSPAEAGNPSAADSPSAPEDTSAADSPSANKDTSAARNQAAADNHGAADDTSAADSPSRDPAHAPVETPLRIQEAAELVGLTPRSIRYYEEMGLLSPSARSQGSYRLFDQLDLDRLRFIKSLRDDAGFAIAEIRRLLEHEAARRLAREAFSATDDPAERRRILTGRLASIDDQLDVLRGKLSRLQEMVGDLELRRAHVLEHLAELGPDEPRAAALGRADAETPAPDAVARVR